MSSTSVWLVTGSSRGLGYAIAEHALESGASVIATARKPEQLEPLVEKYGESKVLALALDVTNPDNVTQVVQQAHRHFGRIDVVVNNAGYADIAPIEDYDLASFKSQLDTNYLGVVYVSQAVLPILRAQRSGYIFQISSIGGRIGTAGLSAYMSAKWAVGGFSTCLASEVAEYNIKVCAVEPGAIRTDWAGSSMSIPPISEAYKGSVGRTEEYLRGQSGEETIDPKKLAGLVWKLSKEEEPPLRFVVGKVAVGLAENMAKGIKETDEKWREWSLSAEYDD